MCKLKSCIVLKDRVFCPDYDSHSDMLEELGIKDTLRDAETKFVRVELLPEDEDIFSPVDKWEMKVDQDILPEWFIPEIDRPRVVDAVKLWASNHIFIDKNNFKLPVGGTYYLKNCKNVTACGNSRGTARGNSQVTAHDNSQVTAHGNSRVTAYGNSRVTAHDNSRVTAHGNSQVTARGNSRVTAWDNSQVTARGNSIGVIMDDIFAAPLESFVLMDNSTLKDCKTKTIYQSGDWKLVAIGCVKR